MIIIINIYLMIDNNIILRTKDFKLFKNLDIELLKKQNNNKIGEQLDEKYEKSDASFATYPTDEEEYINMLDRLYEIAEIHNIENTSNYKNLKLPKPAITFTPKFKKTIWSNFYKICEILKRDTEHIRKYLITEFSTTSSINSQNELILKGKYNLNMIDSIIKKYISEYISCKICGNLNTLLEKDSSSRLYYIICLSCSAKRSVESIKSGFHAISKGERKLLRQ
jgi:translation initiation factor 2 subunit 2